MPYLKSTQYANTRSSEKKPRKALKTPDLWAKHQV